MSTTEQQTKTMIKGIKTTEAQSNCGNEQLPDEMIKETLDVFMAQESQILTWTQQEAHIDTGPALQRIANTMGLKVELTTFHTTYTKPDEAACREGKTGIAVYIIYNPLIIQHKRLNITGELTGHGNKGGKGSDSQFTRIHDNASIKGQITSLHADKGNPETRTQNLIDAFSNLSECQNQQELIAQLAFDFTTVGGDFNLRDLVDKRLLSRAELAEESEASSTRKSGLEETSQRSARPTATITDSPSQKKSKKTTITEKFISPFSRGHYDEPMRVAAATMWLMSGSLTSSSNTYLKAAEEHQEGPTAEINPTNKDEVRRGPLDCIFIANNSEDGPSKSTNALFNQATLITPKSTSTTETASAESSKGSTTTHKSKVDHITIISAPTTIIPGKSDFELSRNNLANRLQRTAPELAMELRTLKDSTLSWKILRSIHNEFTATPNGKIPKMAKEICKKGLDQKEFVQSTQTTVHLKDTDTYKNFSAPKTTAGAAESFFSATFSFKKKNQSSNPVGLVLDDREKSELQTVLAKSEERQATQAKEQLEVQESLRAITLRSANRRGRPLSTLNAAPSTIRPPTPERSPSPEQKTRITSGSSTESELTKPQQSTEPTSLFREKLREGKLRSTETMTQLSDDEPEAGNLGKPTAGP